MKLVFYLFTFVSVCLLSCSKEESILTGSIEGKVSIVNSSGTEIFLEGIKVYLADAGIIDGLSGVENAGNALLDSVLTGPGGKYFMSGILDGTYYVFPDPTPINYRFEPLSGSREWKFTIDRDYKEHLADFRAPDPTPDNSRFTLIIDVQNLPAFMKGDGIQVLEYNISRKSVEYFHREKYELHANKVFLDAFYFSIEEENINNPSNHMWYFNYGYYGINSLTNTFRIDLIQNNVFRFSVFIDLPITGCPEESRWQISWADQTVKRIS